MENELSFDELVQRAKEKIQLGEQLKTEISTTYSHIPGTTKMQRKIQQEIRFLEKIIHTGNIKYNHITSSNLVHFEFLMQTLRIQQRVVQIDSVFPLESRDSPLRVDIVADNGMKWIKVIARNPKSVADAAKGNLNFGARSVLDQAQDYLEASEINFCMFQRPKIVFYFCHQVDDSLCAELHDLGILTATLDAPNDLALPPSNISDILNLDISTMLAYISAVTNGSANWTYKEPLLTEQAEKERAEPLKPILDTLFEGKRLICCQIAYDAFQNIVTTLAGPNERIRADALMKRVEVLPDVVEVPEQLALQFTAKVNERSLKIFSFGMQMCAVTVTSNKAFVRSAKMQGINVPVFMHASRALTENKEFKGTPI